MHGLDIVNNISRISYNLTEIQCICELDLGKVLWNWLYINFLNMKYNFFLFTCTVVLPWNLPLSRIVHVGGFFLRIFLCCHEAIKQIVKSFQTQDIDSKRKCNVSVFKVCLYLLTLHFNYNNIWLPCSWARIFRRLFSRRCTFGSKIVL